MPIVQELPHADAQKRTKTAAVTVHELQPVAAQQVGEKFLGRVLRFVAGKSHGADVDVSGTPVRPAEPVERDSAFRGSGQHQTPFRRRESICRWQRTVGTRG
jgi:hypothetical protein